MLPPIFPALMPRRGWAMVERAPDRVPALMAAKAVALSARTGSLTLHMVDDMRARAEELLGRDDDLRRAVLTFATMYEVYRRDPDALRKLGEGLDRDIEAAIGIVRPELRHRRDIDG
jgi:hypothetical protein